MSRYTEDAHVEVVSFSRQPEGEEVVIGRLEAGSFLALPADAVEVLDDLADGKTVGEARALYRERHGQIPDLEDFLVLLEAKGFIRAAATSSFGGPDRAVAPTRRNHFESISRETAQRIFSPEIVRLSLFCVALGMTAAVLDPRILPDRYSLYFERHQTLSAFTLFFLGYLAVFLHEMGHLVAARAVGIGSRMSISNRLWVVVVETDLTGLWSIPKRDRYLPLLAGALIDAVSASILLLILFAVQHGWIGMPVTLLRLLRALTFLYFMRLLWQCFFFVRTDFYYVIAGTLNCRNLLGDTEVFLRNQLARWGLSTATNQSHIPSTEAWVIRAYAPVWLAGRLLALGILFFVTLPVSFRYLVGVMRTLGAGFSGHRYSFVDAIAMTLFTLVPLGVGIALWVRNLSRGWSTHRATATRPA